MFSFLPSHPRTKRFSMKTCSFGVEIQCAHRARLGNYNLKLRRKLKSADRWPYILSAKPSHAPPTGLLPVSLPPSCPPPGLLPTSLCQLVAFRGNNLRYSFT